MHKRPYLSVRTFLFFSLSLIILFLSFFTNYWQVAAQQWFINQGRDFGSAVMGRLVKSRADGIFSAGGLLGWGMNEDANISRDQFQLNSYYQNLKVSEYSTYNSQIGGQGIFFSLLDKIIPTKPYYKLRIFTAFTAFLTSLSLTILLLWFYCEFGQWVGIFTLIATIFSQWLVVFSKSLFWSTWAFYLPMLVLMFFFKYKKHLNRRQFTQFGLLVFVTVFIKCFFNGYEYMTTTLVMMMVPFVFYSFLDRWNLRKFLTGALIAVGFSLLAILISFVVLSAQLASITGSFQNGINHIKTSFERRTYSDPDQFDLIYADSLKAKTTDVLGVYFNSVYYDKTFSGIFKGWVSKSIISIRYYHLILLFGISSLILWMLRNRFRQKKRNMLALILTTWFSILAPLSWFIIFKSHSFIHTFMNPIVWQMPFTFFGFAVCALTIKVIYNEVVILLHSKAPLNPAS